MFADNSIHFVIALTFLLSIQVVDALAIMRFQLIDTQGRMVVSACFFQFTFLNGLTCFHIAEAHFAVSNLSSQYQLLRQASIHHLNLCKGTIGLTITMSYTMTIPMRVARKVKVAAQRKALLFVAPLPLPASNCVLLDGYLTGLVGG